jgi:hypothetical protein
MPAGEGDPHIRQIDGKQFEFRGEPGVIYEAVRSHQLHVDMMVEHVAGADGPTIISKLMIFPDHGIEIWITPKFGEIRTPSGRISWVQDPGHTRHEGKVYPDPLIGIPHIDFSWGPNITLDPEHTWGVLVDGADHPVEYYAKPDQSPPPEEPEQNPAATDSLL